MRDVARLAGVSTMTVSRVLNESNAVRAETRRRVLAAMRQLNYVPNAVARSLVRGRTDMIALIVSDIQNPYFTTLSRGVEDQAQQYGYTLVVGNSDEDAEKEQEYLNVLAARRIDGIILTTVGTAHLEFLQQRRIPVVLVDRVIPHLEVDTVVHDAYDGGRQLVQHLLQQGYREIAFLGGHPRVSTINDRLAGCRDTMLSRIVAIRPSRPTGFGERGGDRLFAGCRWRHAGSADCREQPGCGGSGRRAAASGPVHTRGYRPGFLWRSQARLKAGPVPDRSTGAGLRDWQDSHGDAARTAYWLDRTGASRSASRAADCSPLDVSDLRRRTFFLSPSRALPGWLVALGRSAAGRWR
jgi:hypothetical protein